MVGIVFVCKGARNVASFLCNLIQALGLVKERLGASGVQLGRKVVVDGQEIVEFIAASEGREYMVGKVGVGCCYCS